MSWPLYRLFRFLRIVKTLSETEDTRRGIIFVLNSAHPGFLSSDLFRLVSKVSNNCFYKFMWLFMVLVIDVVFMIPLLSENEIKYIMHRTVCLTPFSFPSLDGRRPTNYVDFTETVLVTMLLFKPLCHIIFFTLEINVTDTTISSKYQTSRCGYRTFTLYPPVHDLNAGQDT